MFHALKTLTILDPACGSGAFPIGMLQKIVYIFRKVDNKTELWRDDQMSGADYEFQEIVRKKLEAENLDYIRKLCVIRKSIYGVDIQTIATEIAKLRCFLSIIIEDSVDDTKPNREIHPLPNLDFKFISANSLVPLEDVLGGIMPTEVDEKLKKLERVRERYFQADARQRQELKSEFISLQQDILLILIRNGFGVDGRAGQLSAWKPFEIASAEWFDPNWMFGVESFDIVIANPPYIHLEHMKEQSCFVTPLNST